MLSLYMDSPNSRKSSSSSAGPPDQDADFLESRHHTKTAGSLLSYLCEARPLTTTDTNIHCPLPYKLAANLTWQHSCQYATDKGSFRKIKKKFL